MHRQLAFVFVFFVIFMLSGCSFLTEFYLINSSEKSITVEWMAKTAYSVYGVNPTIYGFSKRLGKVRIRESQELPDPYVAKDSIVRHQALLKPNEAVLFGSALNFSLSSDYEKQLVDESLQYIRVSDEDGRELLYSEEITTQLTQQSIRLVYLEVR